MKIVDINNERINASLIFSVGNCVICASMMFDKYHPKIAIFKEGSETILKDELSSIPEAIAWVNMYGPKS